jgi:ATP-dependent helicase/nuclease subunit A
MHPIIAQLQPNEDQKPSVEIRAHNVVVTAGAGTGKTRTLVARYISLLASEVPLRSIVAITFTRKAAREMRSRIRDVIRSYLRQPDLPLSERSHWDDLYNQLDAARIGTIHSLCGEILRAHPAEAGVDPRFEVLEERRGAILQANSIDEALSWAADDDQAVQLFVYLGEYRLKRILAELLAKRLEAQDVFNSLPDPIWPDWEETIVSQLASFVNDSSVRAAFTDLMMLRNDGSLRRAEAHGDALAPHLRKLLDLWEAIHDAVAEEDWMVVSRNLYPLHQSMKLVGSMKAWKPANPKAIIKELRELYSERLGSLANKQINLTLDKEWAGVLPSLTRLYSYVIERYELLKGQGQVLDFDDLEDRSLAILRDYPDVTARWQREIEAILVDEYQDTNRRQRDLVNLINGAGRKLFIVGDAKQSIYRFRGADVTVFRGERLRIDEEGGRAYELSKSYRAHFALIKGLNELLRPVLGEVDDPIRPWREPFAPLIHDRRDAREGITAPFIEMHLTIGSKATGALNRAAEALVGNLVELVERNDGAITFGDIVILCRASTSFGAYESALDRAQVPYLTVSGRGFYDRPEIRDLLNALVSVTDPTDDLALIGLLRSPVMGFSDLELYELIVLWNSADRDGPLWRVLKEEESDKAQRVVRIINELNSKAGRMSVAGLLEGLVALTDYRAGLTLSGNTRAARNVSKLLIDAHNSGIVSVSEFLTYVSGIRAGASREGEAPSTAGDIVRIMTIHAAKGLEFPVVVIGDINYDRRRGSDLILEPSQGVFPNLEDEDGGRSCIFQILLAKEEDQEAAESDRLLYVAATRAMEKLILSGCMKLTKKNHPGYLKGWLKQLNESLGLSHHIIDYNEKGKRAIQIDLHLKDEAVGCTVYEPAYDAHRLPTSGAIKTTEPTDWSPDLLSEIDTGERMMEDESDVSTALGTVVGSLVHDALAVWRFPAEGFDEWLEASARGHGLVEKQEVLEAVERSKLLLRRFHDHGLFREMDSADRRLAEVPYDVTGYSGHVEHRQIDALYLKDGKWTLVDYKTDEIEKGIEAQRFVAEEGYESQVQRYAAAVERFIGQRPRTILCLLDYQGEVYLHPKQDWLQRQL